MTLSVKGAQKTNIQCTSYCNPHNVDELRFNKDCFIEIYRIVTM